MEEVLSELESKISNIGADDLYKRKIGNFEIWFSPLTWTDQGFVQNALEEGANNESESINSLQAAKLKTLARSIVGIDNIDLRKYRNGAKAFTIVGRDKKTVHVDLAQYMEHKIRSWGQTFLDLAFDVYADISESARKKFSEGVVFENAKDPRVELAELEAKVHELRARLGLPVLAEKPGTTYETYQGDLQEASSEQETAVEQETDVPDETLSSKEFVSEEESLPDEPLAPAQSAPQDILGSVEVLDSSKEAPVPEPVRSIPIAEPVNPENLSPIQKALAARRNVARPVRQVPDNAVSSPHAPLEPLPSVSRSEVIEERSQRSNVKPRVDMPVSAQSVNPRFRSAR